MKVFSELLEEYRKERHISKKDLAVRSGLSAGYISLLTRGDRDTPSEETVRALANALDLDSAHRTRFFKDAGYASQESALTHAPSAQVHGARPESVDQADWGEAPDVRDFYGRSDESNILKAWIMAEQCRLVTLLGIGGVGKTTLITTVATQLKDQFDFVYWRSLQNAPSLEDLLRNCIWFLSQRGQLEMAETLDGQIALLMDYLHRQRCLLILDNLETILQINQRAGYYREGYEGYGQLIKRIGEGQHQSCLLLTSREKPREVAYLEGRASRVRSLQLQGIREREGQIILKEKGLYGTEEDYATLVRTYSGNPLALKLVSAPIREVFGGNIIEFLKEGQRVFGDIYELLRQQFDRLSDREREIVYWLAIEREAISLHDLRENIARLVARESLLETLESLRRRSIIESSDVALFTLQPVIMEYVTDRFVHEICEELDSGTFHLFANHALIKAQAKDPVLNSQIRLILKPVADWMLTTFRKEGSENRLQNILTKLREAHPFTRDYVAGNVLNLLVQLGCDLKGYDFSHLMIWQAYLQNVALPEVDFSYADLTKSVFTDTFGSILSVAISPDGKQLAAGTSNNQVRVWSIPDGIPLLTCEGHTDWVYAVAFNHDGSILASSSEDQTIRIWDIATGQCLRVLAGHTNRIWSVSFSPDGQTLTSGSHDQTVRVWDTATWLCTHVLQGHAHRVWSTAFSPDGRLLASGSEDQTIRLWDTTIWRCTHVLQGHSGWVRSVAFSPDSGLLVSGSDDQTIRLWEAQDGSCLTTLYGHTSRVKSVTFSPDGMFIASGSDDQTIRLWDIAQEHCIRTLEKHSNWVWSVAFSPDGKFLASGSDDQTVRLWEVATGQCTKTLLGFAYLVESVAFSPDGEYLASGGGDKILQQWDTSNGQALKALAGHKNWIRSVTFSPDGKMLASGSEDQTIRLWDFNTGHCIKILQGHTNRVWSVTFNPRGSVLASGSEDQTIRLWDIATGQCNKILRGHTNWIWSIAFSFDGRLLASGSGDQTVRLWDANTGQNFRTLHGHTNRVWSVAFSHDGSTLASGCEDQTVRIWSVNSGECIKTLQGHTNLVKSVTFSPDGQLLASASHDQTIRLWEVGTYNCLTTLYGHTNQIRSIVFSPDSRTLASGSHDGTIKLWSLPEGHCFRTLRTDSPYEDMNITGVEGLTAAQKTLLLALGAREM